MVDLIADLIGVRAAKREAPHWRSGARPGSGGGSAAKLLGSRETTRVLSIGQQTATTGKWRKRVGGLSVGGCFCGNPGGEEEGGCRSGDGQREGENSGS